MIIILLFTAQHLYVAISYKPLFPQTPTEQEIDTDSQHRITFNQDSILQLNSLQIYDFLSQLLNSVKFQPLNLTLMKECILINTIYL